MERDQSRKIKWVGKERGIMEESQGGTATNKATRVVVVWKLSTVVTF